MRVALKIFVAAIALTQLSFQKKVVIDFGTGYVKAGYAGDDSPSVVIPNVVGTTRSGTETYVGQEALDNKLVYLTHPMRRGYVTDLEAMQTVLMHIFDNELEIDPSQGHVTMTYSPLAAGATVDQMASVLRDMGAPSVKMVDTAEMTLHSYGLESGLVIETGYEATFVVPIWNGRSIRSAIQKIDIAGDDITMSLMNLVSNQIWYLDSKSFDYADEVKKEYCFFAEDYFSAHATPVHVTFPSDEIVTIGDAQFEAPEILFMPPLDDLAGIGLADAIYESLENVDSYMQDKILSNVVLGGGNSMLRGLKERLEHEFYEMEVSASEDREYSAWIGASKWSL